MENKKRREREEEREEETNIYTWRVSKRPREGVWLPQSSLNSAYEGTLTIPIAKSTAIC